MNRIVNPESITEEVQSLIYCQICYELIMPKEHKPRCC
jgi:hypothetical protein